MIKTSLPIYLASKSPRRRKLLKQIGIEYRTVSVEINEKIAEGENPAAAVKRLAYEKLLQALKKIKTGIIITADTIVVLNGKVIGKPKSKREAEKFLSMLSGKVHIVYTGICVYNTSNKRKKIDLEKTEVQFRKIEKDELKAYVTGGSPMDKAGAYGIQDDFGAVFVKRINGCYYNVVGLPLTKLYHSLRKIT
jgi:septum formation protein